MIRNRPQLGRRGGKQMQGAREKLWAELFRCVWETHIAGRARTNLRLAVRRTLRRVWGIAWRYKALAVRLLCSL